MSIKHKILYVDDEPINLMLFNNMFGKTYEILTAGSGIEGLKILEKNEIKIVFSDMKMPEMDGIEFISIAKSKFPEIVYYILTGYEITPEIKDAINKNLVHGCFHKPFNLKEINEGIDQNLGTI